MITVYGRASSSNVQIVMWTLAEIGLDYERFDYGFGFGGVDTPEYLAMNPNGLIPTLRDGDLVLWESAAIMRYLSARYADDGFWPRDPAARAPLDMWAEWCRTTLAPALNGGVFMPLVRVAPSKRDPAKIARSVEALKPVMRRLDARIGDGPWMAGETLTFADIMVGNLLYRYYTVEFDKAETPALDAYYARLVDRPTYAEHVMVSYEPLRARDV
ncbi:glutathione S-transferase family protein [Pikeienuella piscinae]|uniref:Glutathione S-transferase family protein n=1 Tax=Pikeienuella piscinae TaxID=2748098 RepID=A0A7M3T5N2_9RHOB|nr:glutathione S-transferase family protein [Pikeienuella piscinae]QIE57313.1 glutathione S-transferase family protein [Pikeienuella piscinae]